MIFNVIRKMSPSSSVSTKPNLSIRHIVQGIAMALGLFSCASALAATTYTVTTLADTAGFCSGSSCPTLRAAITASSNFAGNTISLAGLSGTITLTSALPTITKSITIVGPGANSLTLSGGTSYQIFNITSGTVAISGLTLANSGLGEAIYSTGTLTLANMTFSANKGGAVLNDGTLTVTNCTFSGNTGEYGSAIAIYGTATIADSTFSGNSGVNAGGAINNSGATVITNSTFSGNTSNSGSYNPNNGVYGGGAIIDFGSSLAVINSTFAGNSTQAGGGAIETEDGTLIVENSIFTGNTAGGGAAIGGTAVTNASNNLFYQNLDTNGAEDDCSYYCNSNTNAITGQNPNLLPLGNYGGPTQTLLPQPGSPAICAGNYADVPNGVTTDQRGFPLTNSTCNNGGVDMGSVQTNSLQVTTTADSNDGSCSSVCSLRDAITEAIAIGDGADISFATGVTGTITLTSALPPISANMTIMGPGASTLTISGNNAYQILKISSGAVAISGLTLANGSSGLGGAIVNYNTLTVTNSTFSGNSAVGNNSTGGAIANEGTLTLTNSAFSGNSAGEFGGAILSQGTLTVTNSTFSGNSSGEYGGAIALVMGSGTVTDSTFSANSSAYTGGAIYVFMNTPLTIDNNIFTKNSAYNFGGAGIWNGGTANASYNLYYQNLDTGGTEDDCNGCTTNANPITGADPLLAALGAYGGPTQSLLPQPGSPAICAGSASLIPTGITTDQRGFNRTTTYSSNACLDLGAVQTDYTAVAFTGSSYSGITSQAVSPAPVVAVTENGQNTGGIPITLAYSGTGSPTGLGPVTTVGGTGATFSNLQASSPASGTLSVSVPITASTNPVQPSPLTASATLNILYRTQAITFVTSSQQTYGTAPITLSATGGGSGNPVTFSLDAMSTAGVATLSGTNNSTLIINGAGSIVIDANQAGGNGYSAAPQVQQSIMVNPASLTITASSPTVTYGSAVPTITPSFGTFYNGDTSAVLTKQPTCVTAYTTTSAAGSSPSTSCSGATAANYTFTYINGSVAVNQASVAITATSPAVTCGSPVPTITPNFGTFSNGDTSAVLTKQPTCVTSYTTTSAAGSSPSTSCSGAVAANYTFTYINGSVTVNQAPVTITASSPTLTYGSAVPAVTPIFGAFQNGQTSSVLTTQPACVTAYTTSSAAGSSPSTSCSGAVAANYTFTYINGSVAVNKATATINVTPYNVTYNGNAQTATATATGVGGANLVADLTLTGTTHTNAGTYASDSWSFTDPTGNYASASGTVSDIIGQSTVQITASSPTVTYGSAVPTITPIFGAFQNGQTSSVLATQPTCVTAYTTTSAAGSSPSTSCSAAAAVNYTFTYVNGSVTVNQATQAITFAPNPTLTYGIAPITLTATGGGSGNAVTFSLDSTSTAGAATLSGTNNSTLTILGAGTIAIDANQAGNTNYTAAAQVQRSIMVGQATVSITASSPTVNIGAAVPTITPIFGAFVNGDTSAVLTKQPTCTTTYTTTSSVASSPSTSCSGATAANYTFTYVNGIVTVLPPQTFVLSGSSSSLTITPGATTGNTVPITITPANGFTGTVTLTCSITPVAANDPPTCSLLPTSVTITGTTAQTATLTILTTAQSSLKEYRRLMWPSAGTALALVLMIGIPRRRGNWLVVLCLLALSLAIGAVGCGGSGNPGTSAGTYTVTVTGTSGSTTGTVGTITLTVP